MAASTDLKPSGLRLLILSPNDPQNNEDDSSTKVSSTDTSKERFTAFLTSLTGVAPSRDLTTFAGYTSHPQLGIRTKYYAASVNLWCDELPSESFSGTGATEPTLSEWTSQMLSAEAQEVREVIGGIIILTSINTADIRQTTEMETIMKYVTAVNELRDAVEDGSGRDVPAILAVQDATPLAAAERQTPTDRDADIASYVQKLEESCLEEHGIFGWDVVAWNFEDASTSETQNGISGGLSTDTGSLPRQHEIRPSERRNEFGERIGMARIREVLEQANWSASNADDEKSEIDYDLVPTDDFLDNDADFNMPSFKPKITTHREDSKDLMTEQTDEFQQEIMGLHFALEEQNKELPDDGDEAGSDSQVEQLSSLMERAVAIREAGSEMSKADREKFAKREVAKIMKELKFND